MSELIDVQLFFCMLEQSIKGSAPVSLSLDRGSHFETKIDDTLDRRITIFESQFANAALIRRDTLTPCP